MSSKTKYVILLFSSIVVVYTIIGGMMGGVNAQEGSYPQISIFMEVVRRIQEDYVDSPDIKQAMDGAIRGMVERVDPHGGYLRPDVVNFYRTYDPLMAGGIGVRLSKKFDYPVIVATVPGGPADRAGLRSGDTIEGVAGESLREHNLIEVEQLLAGDSGTDVELTVIRRSNPAPDDIRLTREVVAIPPVEARLMESSVGYVKVPLLAPGKAMEAEQQIERLMAEGAERFVLDLRNSAGGSREEALGLANLFVAAGNLGYLEGQTVEREFFRADAEGTLSMVPLVVLINEGTAEAAEIVAAAIRDNGRAEIVGVRSFGLGSVQELIPLADGWALLLSVAKYYSPAGTEIQRNGVSPTLEVTSTAPLDPLATPGEPAETRDRQLDRAIEILLDGAVERAA